MPTDTKSRQNKAQELQLERLFDLLPDDLYSVVAALPYAQRVQVERWYANEADRLSPVMARVAGGAQHATPAVMELLDMLAADPIDTQAAASWLVKHRNELSAQLLAELVSAAMGRGVVNMMSARGKTKRSNTTTKLQKLGIRWLQLEAAGKNKSQAAVVIADELSMAVGTVYNYLQGNVGAKERIYPDGVNAARKALGLLRHDAF